MTEQNTKKEWGIKLLCEKLGMSRQNYYAVRRTRIREKTDADLIIALVNQERQVQPRLGGRKLMVVLKSELEKAGINIGRDKFFRVLSAANLLLERLPRSCRTTRHNPSLPVHRNLLKDTDLTEPNQAWVADITYIRTDEGFMYSALITDAWSRKIVGAHISDSLEAEGCVIALEEALKTLPKGAHPIHHSDRGCQYCCHQFVDRCQQAGIKLSMTEVLHCYENAKAERVNGILKQEYGLGGTFRTKNQARQVLKQAVSLYNYRRPHQALSYRIPGEVHDHAA